MAKVWKDYDKQTIRFRFNVWSCTIRTTYV